MAKSKARDYTETTLKRLFSLSGNQCAFPNCKVLIAYVTKKTIVAQICHIEAAEPGGQRYNPLQTDDERRSFENLMLLCPTHHVITNDVVAYTVPIMQKMKKDHETKMLQQFSEEGGLTKYPTYLVKVINEVATSDFFSAKPIDDGSLASFQIEKKILYNDIKLYRSILDEYKVYQGKLNRIYEQIELVGSNKKDQLLQNIRFSYLKAKDNYTDGTITSVRLHADKLIVEVEKDLWEIIERSNNLGDDIEYEAINMSIQIIIVDAFLRCKILEEPLL